jgi:hypothetical protein
MSEMNAETLLARLDASIQEADRLRRDLRRAIRESDRLARA